MADLHVHGEGCGCEVQALKYDPPDTGPIVVMRQPLEAFITASLDAVPAEILPNLRLACTLRTLRPQLVRGLARGGFEPRWLADWLVENVLFQARLFSELTNADALRLRLEAIDDDGCCRFHTDNVRHRLVCTYRGPGTEWIDPKAAANAEAGVPIDADSIRQLERGAIALMRGGKGASADRPGLVHRSPRIAGTGTVRLLLAIEADTEV